MAAQPGLDMLLKVNTSGSTYVTVGGLRSTTITLNDEMVDATNKDSLGSRAILVGAGVQSVSISASGIFTDATSETTVKAAFFSQAQTSDGSSAQTPAMKNFQFLIPDFGTLTGAFLITSLEYAGEFNGEVTYSMSFESSGYITFAAV